MVLKSRIFIFGYGAQIGQPWPAPQRGLAKRDFVTCHKYQAKPILLPKTNALGKILGTSVSDLEFKPPPQAPGFLSESANPWPARALTTMETLAPVYKILVKKNADPSTNGKMSISNSYF